MISLDTETYDPELIKRGPGWARGVGHIVGASVATEDGHAWYFPMRHEVCPEQNLDPTHVLRWLKDALGSPQQDKLGANLMYDVGWLAEEGVDVKGKLWDVQYAEALLTEDSPTALEYLGNKYVGEGKASNALYQWCANSYGGAATQDQRANMYRTPPSLAGHYAESDATLPIQILRKQWVLLEEQGLLHTFDMECRLIPVLIKMRQQGVSVNIEQAEKMKVTLLDRMNEASRSVHETVGFNVDFWAAASLAKAFDTQHVAYPRTEGGAPSFRQAWLDNLDHPLGKLVCEFRKCSKLRGTFLQSYILDSHINGKVYGQFHPLRGKDGGTRSGRFAASTPNLQNIPTRSDLGKMLRCIFTPDAGHIRWRKFDYSQIEYRFLAHFATGEGADGIRAAYLNDTTTDYHEALRQLIKKACAVELNRGNTKTINFGLTYGMGKRKLIQSLGVGEALGLQLFDAYHKGAPFVHTTMEAAMQQAQEQGFVSTILGRRSRFDKWVPREYTENVTPLPYNAALRQYGNIERAFTHKALNRILQGSSADQLKTAMLQCHDSGLFDYTGYPRLTVHDELDFSDFGGVDDGFVEVKRVMENCLQLRVPALVEESTGPTWGDAK